jgi:excisionase family DNA binding protein
MPSTDDRLWGIEDAAEYLGVPVSAVYKMTSRGSRSPIPHVKLGGRLRFRKADIDRWLDLLSVGSLETLSKIKSAARRAS